MSVCFPSFRHLSSSGVPTWTWKISIPNNRKTIWRINLLLGMMVNQTYWRNTCINWRYHTLTNVRVEQISRHQNISCNPVLPIMNSDRKYGPLKKTWKKNSMGRQRVSGGLQNLSITLIWQSNNAWSTGNAAGAGGRYYYHVFDFGPRSKIKF